MRALGSVAGVRERARLVAARIGAAVKRTAYEAIAMHHSSSFTIKPTPFAALRARAGSPS